MPTAVTTSGLRGLARRIDAGRVKDTEKGRQDELEQLITLFAKNVGDAGQMSWLKAEVPALAAWLNKVPTDSLVRASTEPSELQRLASDLQKSVGDQNADRQAWIDVGLSPAYDDQARTVHRDEDFQFVKEIAGQMRFSMPELSYRPLVSENKETSLWERLTNRELKDDLLLSLMKLGMEPDDISVGETEQIRTWAPNITELNLPPLDAALLFDNQTLRERGAKLAKTSKAEVRRVGGASRPREGEARNVFQLGVEDFKGMRGVAHGLSADAGPQDILQKCRTRLLERGVADPQIELVNVDGQDRLRLPTSEARVLLAPISEGDPACKLSLKPMDRHHAQAKGYDPETGVFLTQAALLAYEDGPTLEQHAALWGLEKSKLIEDKDTDAQVMLTFDPAQNAVVVAFRGTESQADMLTDIDMRSVTAPQYGSGEMHRGFVEQMDSILAPTMEAVKALLKEAGTDPAPTIMLAGHSLGGALAGLFAGAALQEGLPVGPIYTCGQPKIGDDDFTADLGARLQKAGANYFRYVNNSDIVTQMPPQWDHGDAGQEVYFDRFGKAHAPNSQDNWDRFADRTKAATLNLLSGETFDTGPDAFTDHRCGFYVGFARKNRENFFTD